MPLVKVEIAVASAASRTGIIPGDILAINPAGFGWGGGDLMGRIIFTAELDLPCGADWKKWVDVSDMVTSGGISLIDSAEIKEVKKLTIAFITEETGFVTLKQTDDYHWHVLKRCSGCKHHGIDWVDDELVNGSIGYPKISCPVQKYEHVDLWYEFTLNAKGIPGVERHPVHPATHNIDISEDLSAESIGSIASETEILSPQTTVDRLILTRKESNIITENKIVKK